ncbi:MAG: DNA repair protein RecN [Verrucomicrobiota bacterium]|nr:DNA repair protein RecN [Verrucomicrobiota bacterium]
MLTTLRIKNLALVTDLTVEFRSGYNVLTGETGAGKSVILGALNLVLGERADRTLIRSGSDSCTVEALFSVSSLAPALNRLLEESGLDQLVDGELIIRRTFSVAGTNKQFINGSPASLSLLNRIGEHLVDIHGPHDHQSLFHPARQLQILDAFGSLEALGSNVSEVYTRLRNLSEEKASLIGDDRSHAQQMDLLRFQVNEITAAKLAPEEEESLETEYKRASNAARLLQLGQAAQAVLTEEEPSLAGLAGTVGKTIQEMQRLDPSATALLEAQQNLSNSMQELESTISHYLDKIEVDPGRLAELEERLSLIQGLRRKYGSTVSEVISFGEQAGQKLVQLESRGERIQELDVLLEKTEKQLKVAAAELTAARRKLIPKLSKAVISELQALGFKRSHFDVSLTETSVSATGADAVEFQFAPNPGEPPRPLRAIASSGELARVMLAVKTVLAQEDEIPTLIFDEVDANVGGDTATAVGRKMSQIARERQVLCITHLAPVAAAANAHFVVTKESEGNRTISKIRELDGLERVSEIARMLGGAGVAARQHAEALLQDPEMNQHTSGDVLRYHGKTN